MLKISAEKINELFDKIASQQTLYIPVDREDKQAEYKKYESGMTLSKALNTVRSAKDFFFPQTENLAEFKLSGKTIEVKDIRKENEDFVVFGVRACDGAGGEPQNLFPCCLGANPADGTGHCIRAEPAGLRCKRRYDDHQPGRRGTCSTDFSQVCSGAGWNL